MFKATSIGPVASEILLKDQDAQVLGKTQRGVFIKTSGKWLVFLSFEPFRGPLTLTLEGADPGLRRASSGNPVRITSQSIVFPDLEIRITSEGSEVWQPALPPAPRLGDPERHEKLVFLAKEILLKKGGAGLGDLIPALLGLPSAQPAPKGVGRISAPCNTISDIHQNSVRRISTPRNTISDIHQNRINVFSLAYLRQLQDHIRNGETAPLARLLSATLGSGPGLTPSADDFVAGLLLSLNRWQNSLSMASSLSDLNSQLVEAAYQKTTTLSANLIECASLGLANERLVNALDWVMTGAGREPEIVDHLLGWGHSSGVDAFAGMAVTLCSD